MRLSTILYGMVCLITMSISYSCTTNIAGDLELTEKTRIESKDGKVDAILAEHSTGATTSDGVAIFIVRHGKKVSKEDLQSAVFNCDHYSDVNIKWTSNKELLVSYRKARIFNYTNFWEDSDVDNYRYVVEISLNCTSSDHLQLDSSERNPPVN
jgi:hypothetical protein